MTIEHYDRIEILHVKDIDLRRSGGSARVVSYVVRESSTPLRVGFPGEIFITHPSQVELREPLATMFEAKEGMKFAARFVDMVAIDRKGRPYGDPLRLVAVWEWDPPPPQLCMGDLDEGDCPNPATRFVDHGRDGLTYYCDECLESNTILTHPDRDAGRL